MKKRVLAAVLCLALVLAALPMAALAVGESTPTGSETYFFANGTPITIAESAPTDGEPATLNDFTAAGEDAYISWRDGSTIKYIGVSASVVVFGGSDGSVTPVTLEADPSITMSGGTVYRIYAGNLGEDVADDHE